MDITRAFWDEADSSFSIGHIEYLSDDPSFNWESVISSLDLMHPRMDKGLLTMDGNLTLQEFLVEKQTLLYGNRLASSSLKHRSPEAFELLPPGRREPLDSLAKSIDFLFLSWIKDGIKSIADTLLSTMFFHPPPKFQSTFWWDDIVGGGASIDEGVGVTNNSNNNNYNNINKNKNNKNNNDDDETKNLLSTYFYLIKITSSFMVDSICKTDEFQPSLYGIGHLEVCPFAANTTTRKTQTHWIHYFISFLRAIDRSIPPKELLSILEGLKQSFKAFHIENRKEIPFLSKSDFLFEPKLSNLITTGCVRVEFMYPPPAPLNDIFENFILSYVDVVISILKELDGDNDGNNDKGSNRCRRPSRSMLEILCSCELEKDGKNGDFDALLRSTMFKLAQQPPHQQQPLPSRLITELLLLTPPRQHRTIPKLSLRSPAVWSLWLWLHLDLGLIDGDSTEEDKQVLLYLLSLLLPCSYASSIFGAFAESSSSCFIEIISKRRWIVLLEELDIQPLYKKVVMLNAVSFGRIDLATMKKVILTQMVL